jgi:hypothetical protein
MGAFMIVIGSLLILAVPFLFLVSVVQFFRRKNVKKLFFSLLICIVSGLFFGFTGSSMYQSDKTDISDSYETEEKEDNVTDIDELPKESENIDTENEEISAIKEEKVQEDSFLTALKSQLSESVANDAYNILKNDLGFENFTFIKKMDDTTNYVISANGVEVVLTASDKVYRIFIPNSDTVFYEDDTVKMTAKQYEDKQISYGDQSAYYIIAKTIVESALKNPSSAKFPSINTEAGSIAIERNGALVVVQSYVDAKNSFNATVRSNWTVEFMVYDLSTYSYDALYIEIDGEKSGEYIKLDDWVQP